MESWSDCLKCSIIKSEFVYKVDSFSKYIDINKQVSDSKKPSLLDLGKTYGNIQG